MKLLYNTTVICFLLILNLNKVSISNKTFGSVENKSFSTNTFNNYDHINNIDDLDDPVEKFKKVPSTRKCLHFKKNYQKNYSSPLPERKSTNSFLNEIPFEPLRMHFDFSLTLPHEEKMIKELIIPPVKRFFENSLKVRRIMGKLRLPKTLKTCQEVPIPNFLYTQGVDADIVIILSTFKGIKKYNYQKLIEKSTKKDNIKSGSQQKNNINYNNNQSSINNHLNLNENNNVLNHFLENFFKNKPYKKNFVKSFDQQSSLFEKLSIDDFENVTLSSSDQKSNKALLETFKDDINPNLKIETNKNFTNPKILPWEINDGPADVVGWSATCLQDLYTLRPIAGVMQYVADINPTPRAIEEAVWTTLHEITHVLAMDYDLMGDFIDSNFNRKGYENVIKIKTKLVGLSELMEERKEHFNDYFDFANYISTSEKINKNKDKNLNINPTKNMNTKTDPTQKINNFRRDANLENRIFEFDKLIFKQIEISEKNQNSLKSDVNENKYDNLNDKLRVNSLNKFDENKFNPENKITPIDKLELNISDNSIYHKNNLDINFKPKKLRLKNLNFFKETILTQNKQNLIADKEKNINKISFNNKINYRKNTDDILNEETFENYKINFHQGINRIFQSTINDLEKESLELRSVFFMPEESHFLNFSKFKNYSIYNKTDNLNKYHIYNNSNKNKTTIDKHYNQTIDSKEIKENVYQDNNFFSNSTNNNFFDILQKLLKFKRIKMPIQENYVEILVPKNFNLTVLLMYIENFSENTKIFVKTEKVVDIGKKHFECDSLDGVELEHFGGMGSAYSHWSKRILNTEYMIADSYGENYISNFTLAIMEDSGWYKVDYSKSQVIPWGREKGCQFLNDKCIIKKQKFNYFSNINLVSRDDFIIINSTNNTSSYSITNNSNKTLSSINYHEDIKNNNTIESNKKNFINYNNIFEPNFKEEFCTSVNEEECSITHVFRAVCGVNKFNTDVPKQYQYFDDPKIAGITQFGDYCPYPVEWFDNVQLKPVGSCKNGLSLRPLLGEKICENCRCFMSSLVNEDLYEKEKNKKIKKYKNLDGNRAACYEAKCKIENNKLRLTIIVEDYEIKCPRKGGILTIEGYKGFIECPKAENVCFGIMDPKQHFTATSAYGLFTNLSEKLLNIIYDFIYSFFNNQ